MKPDVAPEQIDCVVLIDDETFDNTYHARMIGKTGLARRVECFSMAEDALAWFHENGTDGVDLVLLDINMPRMSGFDFLDRIGDELGPAASRLSVVMVSTSIDPRDQARANSFKMVRGYIQKPLLADGFTDLCRMVHARKRPVSRAS